MPAIGDAVQQYWGEQLELMVTLPAHVAQREPESIHDLRAAGRRVRATVRTFQPLIRKQLAIRLEDGLEWYNGLLGKARDAEVIAEEVAELFTDEPGSGTVLGVLEAEREEAALAADEMLRGPGASRVIGLVGQVAADPWRGSLRSADDAPWLDRLDWTVKRVAREWEQGSQTGEAETEWMHRLRRRAKSARYGFESVADSVDGAADRADAFAKVATLLGVVQDTAVIEQAMAIWPDVVVADVLAQRREMAAEALAEVPAAVRAALQISD